MIVDAARARPGEITLVTLGPLTNLAVALEREPALPRLLRRHVLMGGAFGAPGNTTPTTEWNVHCDPEAARIAFRAWGEAIAADPSVPRPLALGLDVTEQARIGPEHVVALARRAGSTPDDSLGTARRRPARAGSLGRVEPDHPVRRRRPALLLRVPRALRRLLRGVHPRPAGGRRGARPAARHDRAALRRRRDARRADDRHDRRRPAAPHREATELDVAATADVETFLDRLIERVGGLAAIGPASRRSPTARAADRSRPSDPGRRPATGTMSRSTSMPAMTAATISGSGWASAQPAPAANAATARNASRTARMRPGTSCSAATPAHARHRLG